MDFTYESIAKMIDHSLLRPTLTQADLEQGLQTALAYKVAGVCILPYYVKRCAEVLRGSGIRTGTTVGFPHGGHATAVKAAEAQQAISDGAEELDMVVNISKVLSGDWEFVRRDLAAVIDLAHAQDVRMKVIFENCYLNDAQKIRLCKLCGEAGPDWVKTSTGFGPGGAEDSDLRLMREHSPARVQIKAAGGIRTFDRLLEVRALGVTRVGTSATVKILDECKRRLQPH
jgi:deoxyribose-phosphate aldolase